MKLMRTTKWVASYENEEIQALYKDFLGEPLGHKAHELLHTHYTDRQRGSWYSQTT